MKTAIFYFSATGNTKRIADAIKDELSELGVNCDFHDITSYSDRLVTIDLEKYDNFLFGMPIHSCRAPRVGREWMATLDGKGKKCAMFFTFGGFGVHPTHHSTHEILSQSNFVVVSSSEFPGAHTYNFNNGWRSMIDRPDESDFEIAREFARKTYRRFSGEDPGILGEMEKTEMDEAFLDMIEGYRFNVMTELPNRGGKECSMCLLCEESCPTKAIIAETGIADSQKCICCLQCVTNCPDGVLKVNDLSVSWQSKLEMHQTNESELKKTVGKIYL